MTRKQYVITILLAFFVGAVGSIAVGRFFIPYIASTFGIESLNRLATTSPIIVNRTQEIQLNEGVNLIDLARQSGNFTVTLFSTGDSPVFLANGIIMSSDGLIVSSKLALGGREEAVVVLNDGSSRAGLVRAVDPKSDIAVLTIEDRNLPVPTFADTFAMAAGQRVLVIGSSNLPFNHTFEQGYITDTISNSLFSLGREYSTEFLANSFKTDARIDNPFFYGSPLFNLNGRLVGMVTADSKNRIVIAENIQTALTSYLNNGGIIRPRLNINYSQLSLVSARLRGFDRGGVLITSVDQRGPAAGVLRVNDLILEADGRSLESASFEQIVNQRSVGQVKFKILRMGEEIEIDVVLTPTS